VSKYIHPLTLEAATEVASNLRPDDLREVQEGHGIDPTLLPVLMTHDPSYVYFTVPDGKTAGMAGVGEKMVIYGCYAPLIYTDTQLHLQEKRSGMSIAAKSDSFGI
tara:strand:+ start:212 stop:529 length:318 start_codon:yes stop_codon:yes gene_type:complete